MMKNTILLLFLLLGLFACNDDNTTFEVSTEGLNINFNPVAGGAMMHYKLPSNDEIFGMNVRYTDSQGGNVLKSCGYGGDSLLLDGFTQGQQVEARISFVNHRNEESAAGVYSFNTLDSAPWAFFNNVEVLSSWNGFQVIYKSPSVVTGTVHIFYLGTNPLTQKEDTILVNSFPISRGGDTLNFVTKQSRDKNTIIIRTEDFQGYRVKQQIYPDVDAFPTEQWKMAPEDLNDFGLSIENTKAKTGKQYLFDGELRGRERLTIGMTNDPLNTRNGVSVYATYLVGPYAFGKPLILDLREQKIPAWIRMYCLQPEFFNHAVSPAELGHIWVAGYDDKLPCSLTVYGNAESSDLNSDKWVYLGQLNQDPKAITSKDRWCFLNTEVKSSPKTLDELEAKDPIYVDVSFPPVNNTYRYLKIVVNNTFMRKGMEYNYNQQEYFTMHELEVYVKKN